MIEDKNLLLALALKNKGGGGGGGGELPDVTAADNGKVLGVDNGAWAKTDVPYTKTTVLFSGNATVEEI